MMTFSLVINLLALLFFIYILHWVGIRKHVVILTGFATFGIIVGLDAALNPPECGIGTIQSLVVNWGDGVYEQSINHFGDPHSAFAHFTVPWFLRIPQVYFFTSVLVYIPAGLLAQFIFNRITRAKAMKSIQTWVILAMLAVSLCVSTITVYARHDGKDKYPTQPVIFPSAVPVSTWQSEEWQTWGTITSYDVDSLFFETATAKKGHEYVVTGNVKNTGPKKGKVIIGLEVDGVTKSNETYLLPGESKSVSFVIIFPRGGTFLISMDDLSEYVTVED